MTPTVTALAAKPERWIIRGILISLVALSPVFGACGDDDAVVTTATATTSVIATTAPSTTAPATITTPVATTTTAAVPIAFVDTFDGVSLVELVFPPSAILDLSDAGVAHFVTTEINSGTLYLALYPDRYTFGDGDVTLVFRLGEPMPTFAMVTIWSTPNFVSGVEVNINPTALFSSISWYDYNASGYHETDFAIPPGIYDPDGFNTLVIHAAEGTVAIELNGFHLGEVAVPLEIQEGGLVWGMFPGPVGSDLIVDEFTATPAG